MKVILTENIDKLGKMGEVVNVARGYARNYLLPRKIALLATDGNIAHVNEKLKVEKRRSEKRLKDAVKLVAKLDGLKLVFTARAGEGGKLYGSITNKDIAEEILVKHEIEVDRRKIVLDEPVKNVGTYEVPVVYHSEAKATVQVEVKGLVEEEAAE